MKNFTFLLVLFLGIEAFGATYCVGPSATGSGSGADWNNLKAWSATPVRGDTWYLVDGSYGAKTLSTADSGTTLITIYKATVASHGGISTGWSDTYGDGQATFTGLITVNSSYWVIDGQKGSGFSTLPPGTNGSDYGITMTDGYMCVTIPPPAGHLTLSHIYASAAMNDSGAGAGWFVSDGNTGSGTVDSVTVSYCLLVGWGQAVRADKTWNNLLFDHNCYWTIYASSVAHANPINASWGEINNATVRYSLFYKNVPGTWGFSQVIAANNNNWNNAKIYGNVFDHCWAGRSIISGNGRANDAIYGTLVYNNTFLWSSEGYPNDGGGLIGDEYSSGNTFVNNLAFACRATVGSSANDYNEYVATWSHPTEPHGVIIAGSYNPFTSAETQVYKLKTNTPAGTPLGAEYAQDALGNSRTTWSRGAFEYNSGTITNAVISISPRSRDFGAIAVGVTSDLTFTVQNVGGGTLSGVATVAAPFSILSGGTYNLGSNQSQTVTVRYRPTAVGNHGQTITYTGGGGAVASVSGVAYSMLPGTSFAADAGVISSPFVSSGGVVSQSVDSGVSDGGRAVYAFSLPNTGDYLVQAVVNAPSDAENSLYINIDADPTDPYMVWHIPTTSGFQTSYVSWQGAGTWDVPEFTNKVFSLTAGNHQLNIWGREKNTQIQRISIVSAVQPMPPTNVRVVATQ